MTRQKTIYLDWNLYSILKSPTFDSHLILSEFLNENRDKIRLVYSPAHLDDLKQTSSDNLDKLSRDLEYISKMTQHTCIVNYWGSSDIIIDKREAIEFFEQNKEDNSGASMQAVALMIKKMGNQYGDLRDRVIREHFKTDPSQICNFNKKQLDELIRIIGISESLDDFLKFGLQLRTSPTDILGYIDLYYTAYTSLDIIGYYLDKFTEKGGFENLMNDAKHSAYGSVCDCFITNDNKCYHKSRFLFDYYNCKSKLVRTCRVSDNNILKKELNEILQ